MCNEVGSYAYMKETKADVLDSLLGQVAYRGLTEEIVVLKSNSHTEYYVTAEDFESLRGDLSPLMVGFVESQTLRDLKLPRDYPRDMIRQHDNKLKDKIGFTCNAEVMDILIDNRLSYHSFFVYKYSVSD